jgi:hypothetical protein
MKELGGPKVGGARLRHSLGGLPGNATLKDDFVFWVKALPSRARGAAIIQGFELDRVYIRFALVRNLMQPHAGPRLRLRQHNLQTLIACRGYVGQVGGFPAPAYYRFTELGTLLTLKGRSGASPYQSWALATVSLTQHDYAGSTLGYDL